ncbi:MAG: MaoC/PaaZ C-terminal domain-containing protein, partial [Gammaproteobacteria bacterium]
MSRKPSRLADGLTIPEMEAVQAPRPIDGMHLRDYRRVCGLEETDAVPLVYPHVLAAPAQLALLSHPDFPLRLLGLVHLKNEIVQYRLIAPGDQLGLRVSVGGHRDT